MSYIMDNNIITEFNKIFKHETFLTNDKYIYLNNEIINYIENHKDILLIINCEYDAPKNECVINYYNQYWGNTAFNNILEKYKLRYEFYNEYLVFIYKDNDYDNL